MSVVWINGSYIEDEQAGVSLHDTGLLHGAGVFTTMRSYGGKVFRAGEHLKRLRRSCEVLFIPLQYKDESLSETMGELLRRNGLADARLRLTATRGAARQDPLHGLHLTPTVFLTAAAVEPYPREYYERGMTVIVLDDQKLNPYDVQAGHKTLNYYSRLAALREATERGAGEALWFNVHNYLESGSVSNVFVVREGRLMTPPTQQDLQDRAISDAAAYPKSAALPGITRQTVIELARQNEIAVTIAGITISHLLASEEVFLTNSIMGVMPVCRIERHAIGDDRPGRITRRVGELYEAEIRRSLA